MKRYGIDKIYGDAFNGSLDFTDAYFDYVTMLAVIEHFNDPEAVFKEIHRILKPDGLFIFTTPKDKSEKIIKIYEKNIEEQHESYFDPEKVQNLSKNLFEISGFRTFIFGLNQIFVLKKIQK
ncbi:MAG: hypothetical protein ACD_79C01437G0004 [uncultured bacterium]|nr:MAG: hypothetical protein ACD_79C01437G0004 [uncultured bacterium]